MMTSTNCRCDSQSHMLGGSENDHEYKSAVEMVNASAEILVNRKPYPVILYGICPLMMSASSAGACTDLPLRSLTLSLLKTEPSGSHR